VSTPSPGQINLVVSDLARSMEFYRLLGWMAEPAGPHAAYVFDGFRVELDEYGFARQWNSGTPPVSGGSCVFCLNVSGRDDVDEVVGRVTGAGHRLVQKPYDAFWGSRMAVVADPDGYQIGLMSPIEPERRFWPPSQAPGPGS
jgi:predicted enzyme related to lactoylglutathione lyase